jgi:glycosyltransferase involved in cell wall biosynthesis
MKVLLAGGVYRLDKEARGRQQSTPEMVLEHGLRARGVSVSTMPLEKRWAIATAGGHDIVHVHHLSKAAVAACVSPRRTPVALTLHSFGAPKRLTESVGLKAAMRGANAIVCLSDAELMQRSMAFPSAAERMHVIPNGIAMFEPEDQPRAWTAGPLRLLFVGQLIDVKRVDRVIETVAKHPDVVARLVFHNDELEPSLRRLCAARGVIDRVEFVGQAFGEALRAEYAAAHALVLPSVSEALPSVVTEALCTGLPVLASDVGGVRSQVVTAGILSDRLDDLGLESSVRELKANYGHYAEAAFSRSREVREELSIDRMIRGHLSLYRELMGGRE